MKRRTQKPIARVILFTLAVIAIVLILTACGRLTDGVVVGKDCTPAHYESHTAIIFTGKVCVPITSTRWVPDQYSIQVQGQDKSGETVTECWSVSKAEYNALNIGDHVQRED